MVDVTRGQVRDALINSHDDPSDPNLTWLEANEVEGFVDQLDLQLDLPSDIAFDDGSGGSIDFTESQRSQLIGALEQALLNKSSLSIDDTLKVVQATDLGENDGPTTTSSSSSSSTDATLETGTASRRSSTPAEEPSEPTFSPSAVDFQQLKDALDPTNLEVYLTNFPF